MTVRVLDTWCHLPMPMQRGYGEAAGHRYDVGCRLPLGVARLCINSVGVVSE